MEADQLRYDDLRQKSIHNAYQRREGIPDQFLYWRIRSMEIDIHHRDVFGEEIIDDWALYHDWHDPMSSVARLSQSLQIFRSLSMTVPEHEVVTLFVDIKDPFPRNTNSRHSWKMLDSMLERYLGDRLFRPRDLLDRAPGVTRLRKAIEVAGWPTVRELRGRFIVVLTGSPTQLEHYARTPSHAVDRSAFLSAPVDGPGDIPGPGDQLFFNINGEKRMHLVERVPDGCISRAYYVNDIDSWRAAARSGCHHIATDMVNERTDGWARTRNAAGFPFERVDGRRVGLAEPGAATGVWATSGDIWDRRDSFYFNHRTFRGAAMDRTWEFAISGPNSHTEDFTKGAVMARAGLEPDAAYFAVVRAGEKHGVRVQVRPDKGDPTTAWSRAIGPSGLWGNDVDPDTVVHVRLTVDRKGRRAQAWLAYDLGAGRRGAWEPIGRFEFTKPLRHHGLAVSSHDQRRGAKFLFVPAPSNGDATFDEGLLIGGSKSHRGWHDSAGSTRWLTRDLAKGTTTRARRMPRRRNQRVS